MQYLKYFFPITTTLLFSPHGYTTCPPGGVFKFIFQEKDDKIFKLQLQLVRRNSYQNSFYTFATFSKFAHLFTGDTGKKCILWYIYIEKEKNLCSVMKNMLKCILKIHLIKTVNSQLKKMYNLLKKI